MTLTPEALDELVERLRDAAPIENAQIVLSYDAPAEYESLDALLRAAADAIAALRKERDEARERADRVEANMAADRVLERSLERERCARIAERMSDADPNPDDSVFGFNAACEQLAAAIRSDDTTPSNDESLRTARDLERERCAMLAEMAGQMDLAKQIRAIDPECSG